MDESEHGQPLVAFDSQALRRLKPRQLAARFAFGAVASLIAGAVSIVLGPSIGGLFLAFPAILPATLTLLEREHGRVAAVFDMQGAALGAVALIAPRADDLSHGRVGETTARVIAGAPRMIDGGGTASRPASAHLPPRRHRLVTTKL